MGWQHEYWDNGICYFSKEGWDRLSQELQLQYPHNEHHRRICMTLAWPREKLEDVPITESNSLFGGGTGHNIISEDRTYSVIFDVFPRWYNPHNHHEESWRIFAEDGHQPPTLGEPLVIYTTTGSFKSGNAFCFFRNRYWRILEAEGGHYGPHPAPPKKKTSRFWSIDDLV